MQLQQIYAWSKKIHRWVLWFVTALGMWMMLSGYLMHKEMEGESMLSVEAMTVIRIWHNNVSQYFLLVLLIQMGTGLLMWGIPQLLSRRVAKSSTPPINPPPVTPVN